MKQNDGIEERERGRENAVRPRNAATHAAASTGGNHDALPSIRSKVHTRRYTNDVGNALGRSQYLSLDLAFSRFSPSCALACDRCRPVGMALSQSIAQ